MINLGIFKNLIKWVPWIIILGLVIALSVTQCSKQEIKFENHEEELKQVIAEKSKRVVALDNRVEDLLEKMKEDSLKSVASLRASNKRIAQLERKVASSRVDAQPDIDKSPTVTEFVEDTDSLISELQVRNDTLMKENSRIWNNFSNIITVEEEKSVMQSELITHHQDVNKELNKQLKRERRKKTFWKGTAFVAIVAAVAKAIGVF